MLTTAEKLFKYKKIIRDYKKGGLDIVFYTYKILEKHLIPYYKEVQRLQPTKEVFIVKDNVSVYYKARRILVPILKAKNIKFLNTPSNSLDINPIKHV
jgi:hypothetical protein